LYELNKLYNKLIQCFIIAAGFGLFFVIVFFTYDVANKTSEGNPTIANYAIFMIAGVPTAALLVIGTMVIYKTIPLIDTLVGKIVAAVLSLIALATFSYLFYLLIDFIVAIVTGG